MALDHSNNSKLMWIIVAGLVIIVTLAVLFLWMSSKESSIDTVNIESSETRTETVAVNSTAIRESSLETVALNTAADVKVLVSDSILKDKIPQNTTFAEEEIAKLNDLQQQLQTQHETLEAQQSDADQILALKEEQIKLLEEQLSVRN